MITKESFQEYKRTQEEINQKIDEVLHIMTIIETEETYLGDIEKVIFENGLVNITTIEPARYSGCGDEFNYYEFPERFLYEDWEEEFSEEIRKVKEAMERIRIEAERIAEQKKMVRDRERYEELKKRFEGK